MIGIVICCFVIKLFKVCEIFIYEKIIWLDFVKGFDGLYVN